MNTTPYLTTNLGKERPEGDPTPIRFVALGDIVAIHSRGQYRTAVVTKIGKTNVTTSYITEGGIKEATDLLGYHRTAYNMGRDAYVAKVLVHHYSEWDSMVAKVDAGLDAMKAEYGDRDWVTESFDKAVAKVAAGRDAYLRKPTQNANRRYDDIVRDVARTPAELATETNKKAKEFWVVG